MAKRFKTIAGYLRSMSDDFYAAQARAEIQGRKPMSDEEGQRQILNNLLRQLGLGQISNNEHPSDGIRRLQLITTLTEQQKKDLATCWKWCERPTPRVTFLGTGGATSTAMTFGGERFTAEQTERLEQICREREVTMAEAIEIFRQ